MPEIDLREEVLRVKFIKSGRAVVNVQNSMVHLLAIGEPSSDKLLSGARKVLCQGLSILVSRVPKNKRPDRVCKLCWNFYINMRTYDRANE